MHGRGSPLYQSADVRLALIGSKRTTGERDWPLSARSAAESLRPRSPNAFSLFLFLSFIIQLFESAELLRPPVKLWLHNRFHIQVQGSRMGEEETDLGVFLISLYFKNLWEES